MNANNQNRFKELITSIADTYSKEFTPAELKLWWNMFKPHSIEEFEKAVYQHMADPDQGMFTPKPANIMKFIIGTTKQNDQAIEDKAELAWHVIEGEIRRIGSYGTLKLEDKQALAAIQAIGGWSNLCSKTIDQLVWAHKEFVSAYKNYERTPVEALPENLPGREELSQHKQSIGFEQLIDKMNEADQ